MLVTLTTTRVPATDLGYLLHKHPDRAQPFELTFGKALVFYPEASPECCTAALLLDVDPVGLVRRGRGARDGFALQQYVNDRPYVASSFLSVAIGQVFGTAMAGKCAARPELVTQDWPLEARLPTLPCRGGQALLRRLFDPLGYEVDARGGMLDERFAEWGDSPYLDVRLRRTGRLQDLLNHLYVLIPVLDNDKHYWVGRDEIEKLLRKGADWLAAHPEKALITRRYLKHQHGLTRSALARLADEDHPDPDAEAAVRAGEEQQLEAAVAVAAAPSVEDTGATADACDGAAAGTAAGDGGASFDATAPLHVQRMQAVLDVLAQREVRSVVDLGCGEGKLLRRLLRERMPIAAASVSAESSPGAQTDPAPSLTLRSRLRFERILGLDVSVRALQIAGQRLKLDEMPERRRARIGLIHGALTYRDARLSGFDAAVAVEVIEHLELERLPAFERVVFEFAKPRVFVVTTPNREYNVMWPSLPAGRMRHRDHRFEWTRAEFRAWAEQAAARFGYSFAWRPIGPSDETHGPPTQMGVFVRVKDAAASGAGGGGG